MFGAPPSRFYEPPAAESNRIRFRQYETRSVRSKGGPKSEISPRNTLIDASPSPSVPFSTIFFFFHYTCKRFFYYSRPHGSPWKIAAERLTTEPRAEFGR